MEKFLKLKDTWEAPIVLRERRKVQVKIHEMGKTNHCSGCDSGLCSFTHNFFDNKNYSTFLHTHTSLYITVYLIPVNMSLKHTSFSKGLTLNSEYVVDSKRKEQK